MRGRSNRERAGWRGVISQSILLGSGTHCTAYHVIDSFDCLGTDFDSLS